MDRHVHDNNGLVQNGGHFRQYLSDQGTIYNATCENYKKTSDEYGFQCMRGVEADFPQPRGVKKKQMSKYLVGGGALFLIIGLIWFPLLLFALGGTVGDSNLPYDVSMRIRIGPYEPIYSMSAQTSSIVGYSQVQYKQFTNLYATDRPAVTFLENYIHSDVAAVRLSGFSRKLWGISPPDLQR